MKIVNSHLSHRNEYTLMIKLINSLIISEITKKRSALICDKAILEYNLFTLSSYNNHRENFHSDIIASLLNPDGLHCEKNLFLKGFIDYLNREHKCHIEYTYFENAKVERESGRLDILVHDPIKKKAIIFENKINDAPDMEDQLIRYYSWCEKKGYDIEVIIYASLRGINKAPPIDNVKDLLVKNIAFFSDEQDDLLNGWLKRVKPECRTNDSRSLIKQYCKLVKYLAFDSMEKKNIADFYETANTDGFFSKVETLSTYVEYLPTFRAENLIEAIHTDITPFQKIKQFKPKYCGTVLIENYFEGDEKYKIDIIFHVNGDADFLFWNTGNSTEQGTEATKKRIEEIGYQDMFKQNNNRRFIKNFTKEIYGSLKGVDESVTEFTKEMIKKLRNSALK